MLSDGLRATGKAGKPKQYFCEKLEARYGAQYQLDPAADYADYVRRVVLAAATPNHVFGCKLMGWDLQPFLARLRRTLAFGPPNAPDLLLLRAALPGLKFIYIRRRDRLRQAISKARALQSDIWRFDQSKQPLSPAEFDPKLISHCIEDVTREEEILSEFFEQSRIKPFFFEYEDFCHDYQGCLEAALKFLGLRVPRGITLRGPLTIRQADATSEEWETRYRALASVALSSKM